MASQGVRFEHCYVNNPICTPSRASLMTGHDLLTHGVHQLYSRLADNFTLFPKHLQALGYHTSLVGKLHVSDYKIEANVRHPNDGFDNYQWCHDPTIALDSPFNAYAQWLAKKNPDYLALLKEKRWDAPPPAHLHMTTWAAQATIDLIRNRPSDKPFFCMMSVFDPHNPYHDCPSEYAAKVDMTKMPPRVGMDQDIRTTPSGIQQEHDRSYMGPYSKYTQQDIDAMRRGYHGSVSLIDEQVGHVLDELEKQGISDNTLVIFVSDHGDMLGDHQLLVKGAFFYDACTRVPLLMRWPAQLHASQVRNDLAQINDLTATILAAAGMSSDTLAKLMPQSQNLLPVETLIKTGSVIKTGSDPISISPREYAVCHYLNTGISHGGQYFEPPIFASMIRDDRFKLNVYWHGQNGCEYQLFDMLDDPNELTDLADDPKASFVKERLKPRIEAVVQGQNFAAVGS
jgi:arylsulfatase A-like enzyme